MPAKRRASKRKAPETEKEEVKAEPVAQPVPEPVVEEPEVNDDEEEDPEETPEKELTDEEKIAELDKLSKAHPFGLLANLAKLSNKHRAVFQIKKNEGETDESMHLVARFGEIKITVAKVPGENFKFAKKIGSDMILGEIYGDKHELDLETEQVKEANPDIEIAQDAEWYKEKKAEYATSCSERVDRIIKRIQKNDKYDEEAKKQKIEKFETWRICKEDVLDYDEVYRVFDHPYYRVMHNALTYPRNKGLKYETKLFKFEGEKEVEILTAGKGEKRTQEEKDANAAAAAAENAETLTKFKVCVTVFQNDKPLLELEHTDETNKLREAKSEAAYKILEKLLLDKVISRVTRRELKNRNDRNNMRQFGNRNMKGRGKGGNKNQKGNKKGGNKANPNQNKQKQQQNIMTQPMMGGMQTMPGGGQMMMMPVMMGPNGQMMIASNSGPMMMPNMMQAGMVTGPPPAKKKKNNKKKNTKKN